MFEIIYHQAYSDKYITKCEGGFFDGKDYNKVLLNMGKDEVGRDLIGSQAIR